METHVVDFHKKNKKICVNVVENPPRIKLKSRDMLNIWNVIFCAEEDTKREFQISAKKTSQDL